MNYGIGEQGLKKDLEPLYCLAISPKRYVLFNKDAQGRPLIRKAMAHGLGHLLSPYDDEDASASIPKPARTLPEIGVVRWQYDLWYQIIRAASLGNPEQVDLSRLPGFDKPAVSRYAATNPSLLRWFDEYNRGKPYAEQVKPFNFMLMFQTSPLAWRARTIPRGDKANDHFPELPSAVAPYGKNPDQAVRRCFDRNTGKATPRNLLKTYKEALASYHLHPESKYLHADYTDKGITQRRHIAATFIEHIGKEANRWEEQLYLGQDPEAQIEYVNQDRMLGTVLRGAQRFSQRDLAKAANVSVREVSHILMGTRKPSRQTLMALYQALSKLEAGRREQIEHGMYVIAAVKEICQMSGVRQFARVAGIDPTNLSGVLSGKRKLSTRTMAKLQKALASSDNVGRD